MNAHTTSTLYTTGIVECITSENQQIRFTRYNIPADQVMQVLTEDEKEHILTQYPAVTSCSTSYRHQGEWLVPSEWHEKEVTLLKTATGNAMTPQKKETRNAISPLLTTGTKILTLFLGGNTIYHGFSAYSYARVGKYRKAFTHGVTAAISGISCLALSRLILKI